MKQPPADVPWIHITSHGHLMINNAAWALLPKSKNYTLWLETDVKGIKWLKLLPANVYIRRTILSLNLTHKDNPNHSRYLNIPKYHSLYTSRAVREQLGSGMAGIYLTLYDDGKFRPML